MVTRSAPANAAGDVASVAVTIRGRLGAAKVVEDPTELETYACDGLAQYRVRPALVVLAEGADDIVGAVTECARARVPFVARGSGTGLSGGALPHAEGVLIVTARMRSVKEVAPDDMAAVVEPGVINLDVTHAAAPYGLHYAPDPSSQQICSIGGNVAENSGGAHCLKYGFTTNHVLAATVVLPDGDTVRLGGEAPAGDAPDLLGAFIGAEGTLGITTSVTVRLLRRPQQVHTLLADFPDVESAGDAVSSIIAAGVVPAAMEMMDALSIRAADVGPWLADTGPEGYRLAEDAQQPNSPAPAVDPNAEGSADGAGRRVAAALLVEVDGPETECACTFAQVERMCRENGCGGLRVARDPDERAGLWRGRKAAFASMGRISPDYIVQDGVIPRARLSDVLARMATLAQRAGLRVANVFHAGDGNLHPLVLYDASAGEQPAAEALSTEIAELCVAWGGSLTGEHGVGTDKACSMPRMFSEVDLETMLLLRNALDTAGLCNPGKGFPTPRLCGERPGPYRPHALEEEGVLQRW